MPCHADRARAIARTGLLVTAAAVLGYLEATMMVPMPVAGLRLGLANVAVLIAFAAVGPANALLVSLGRVLLVGLATGTLFGPVGLMSVVAALAAWCAMALAYRWTGFSVAGWSMAGSTAHVMAQLGVASLLVGTPAPLLMTPVSLALALATGLAIGFVSNLLLVRIPSPRMSLVLHEG